MTDGETVGESIYKTMALRVEVFTDTSIEFTHKSPKSIYAGDYMYQHYFFRLYVEILFGERNGKHWRTKTMYCFCRECGNNLVPGDENVINGSVEKVGYPIWGTPWGSCGVVFGVAVFSMKNDFERITK